jgi:hypothetical protein
LSSDCRKGLKGLPLQDLGDQEDYPVFIAEAVQDVDGLGALNLDAWTSENLPKACRTATDEERQKWLLRGFFMVNLLYPPDEIVKNFKVWLLKRHPEAGKPAAEKRGRKSYRDRLNALGAMRLRFYCRNFKVAQTLVAPLQKKKHGLYYSDRNAWNRACTRSVEYFREILGVKETDLPIHYSKGWQK